MITNETDVCHMTTHHSPVMMKVKVLTNFTCLCTTKMMETKTYRMVILSDQTFLYSRGLFVHFQIWNNSYSLSVMLDKLSGEQSGVWFYILDKQGSMQDIDDLSGIWNAFLNQTVSIVRKSSYFASIIVWLRLLLNLPNELSGTTNLCRQKRTSSFLTFLIS